MKTYENGCSNFSSIQFERDCIKIASENGKKMWARNKKVLKAQLVRPSYSSGLPSPQGHKCKQWINYPTDQTFNNNSIHPLTPRGERHETQLFNIDTVLTNALVYYYTVVSFLHVTLRPEQGSSTFSSTLQNGHGEWITHECFPKHL